MAPLYLYNGLLLVRDNALAVEQSCCCCPEKTIYVRSGVGSNGVPTYVHPAWGAGGGPTLSGSVWIWSTSTVQNPTSASTFSFFQSFTLPSDADVVSAYINVAVDNTGGGTVNGLAGFSATDNFGVADGSRFVIPKSAIQPGLNVISGSVNNFAAEKEATYQTNPAGIIYALVCTYRSCY